MEDRVESQIRSGVLSFGLFVKTLSSHTTNNPSTETSSVENAVFEGTNRRRIEDLTTAVRLELLGSKGTDLGVKLGRLVIPREDDINETLRKGLLGV